MARGKKSVSDKVSVLLLLPTATITALPCPWSLLAKPTPLHTMAMAVSHGKGWDLCKFCSEGEEQRTIAALEPVWCSG